MSVDLANLRDDLNCDVYPWLGQFETLISISATYSSGIVKLFYYNMTSDNLVDSDGELVEERISTYVRGRHMYITASILNQILLIDNPPPMPEFYYTNERIFQILRPGEDISDEERVRLSFTPATMPPLYRVVWYIYSRNLLQKGGNYTHFAQKDYPVFAGLIDKRPINVGEWLFKEMSRFRFGSRTASHVPFPSLVSVILFYHKIWPIGTNTSEHRVPTPFGQHQLNLMHISFGEDSGQSRAPSRSKKSYTKASKSRVQEAESAPSLPSDFESKLQEMVDKAMDKLAERIESEMTNVLNKVSQEYNELADAQADLAATLGTLFVGSARLDEKVDKILNLLAPSEPCPSPGFGSTFATPQDPTPPFQFTTPPPTIPLSPPTAATEIIPPTHTPAPSTATERLESPTGSSATALFEDAKGGEDDS